MAVFLSTLIIVAVVFLLVVAEKCRVSSSLSSLIFALMWHYLWFCITFQQMVFTTCNVTENFFHKFLCYSFVSCHDWYTVKFLFLFSSVYSSYKYAQPIMPFSVTIFLNSAGCTRSCSKSFQKNCPVTNNLQGGCNSTCSHTLHRCCWKYCK